MGNIIEKTMLSSLQCISISIDMFSFVLGIKMVLVHISVVSAIQHKGLSCIISHGQTNSASYLSIKIINAWWNDQVE